MASANTKFKIPTKLAACADLLYQTRERRLALNREAEELERQEAALKEHLINNLPKSLSTGVAGTVARAAIVTKEIPTVKDWDGLQGYILSNAKKDPGVWALIGRKLNTKPAEELMRSPQGKKLKFLEFFQAKSVSVTKVG